MAGAEQKLDLGRSRVGAEQESSKAGAGQDKARRRADALFLFWPISALNTISRAGARAGQKQEQSRIGAGKAQEQARSRS